MDWIEMLLVGLVLIFAAGKIFNFIDWSWWTVFFPLWGMILLILIVFLVIIAFIFIWYGLLGK